MKTKLFKIALIVLMFLGLVIAGVFLTQAENQVSANDSTTIQKPLPKPAPLKFSISGRIERTGTYFEIEDSEYINITLKSTEEIKVVLESIPRMISINLESSSTSSSTIFTLEGLEPNKTYYRYQDSYKNGAVFVLDEIGSYSWTQDLSQAHHIWFQEAPNVISRDFVSFLSLTQQAIFLPEQCSAYGTWDSKTSTCTLNQDLTQSVEMTDNNISLDCNDHSITGSGFSGYGIYLNSKTGIAIQKCFIKSFSSNIYLWNSDNNYFSDNSIEGQWKGISLSSSFNNIITNNNISDHLSFGIDISSVDSNKVYHNNFINNGTLNAPPCSNCGTQAYIRAGNIDNGYPSGGNYWSDYVSRVQGEDLYSGPNQDQPGSDGIGDIPYKSFGSGQDRYPFVEESGWEAPINQPPTISEIDQFRSDGQTLIGEGTITTESTVVFKATLNDSDNDQIKLQIELKEFNQPFNGQNLLESEFLPSGSEVSITRANLVNGQYHWRARAVDSRGATSDWQEFGEIGNVDFEVKLVPLYTQVFSKYPSELETLLWSRRNYAYATPEKPYSSCGWLIRDCGCAITSMVMLGRYYDIGIAIDSNNVDPGNINTWLTNNKGYELNGDLRWGNTIEYLGFIDERTGKKMARLDFKPNTDFNVSSASPRIDNFLALAKPIVARSKTFGHYFVIDGKIKAGTIDYTYTLKDPTWYNTKRLNQPKNLIEHIQGYNNHFDTANLFSYLETPKPITASIYIHLASPAELLITDPLGRKLGKDPTAGIVYDEIPDSIYTQEGPIVSSDTPLDPNEIPESKIIYIPSPIDGEYDIKVIGTDSGSYTIGLSLYDDNGNSKDIAKEGNTITNDIQEFKLDFSTQTVQETEAYRIVNIDIKPGSYPNSINLKSRGVLPVAVLTDNFFNAKDIVVNSVLFAGAEPLRGNLEDVDKDGDLDLILHFDTRLLKLTSTDTEAILSARLKDNALIKGTDSVRIVGELGFLASIINATRGIIDTIIGAIFNFFGLQ